jgi:YegS/Rv2252/BmrU family lipid kinase
MGKGPAKASIMSSVAVVAHSGKTLGGGLKELRSVLKDAGCRKPTWFEVSKSKKAPKAMLRAVKDGAKLIFVWGGDGMVQRCVDALNGSDAALAILPAGTANLLATNLGIPKSISEAVAIGLHGERRELDVGVMNGERFAVMAGTGFDATVVDEAGKKEKKLLGRLAYVRSGVKAMRGNRIGMKVWVDGRLWFTGKASCVLIGNIGKAMAGLRVFRRASPCDGVLDVGVVSADNAWQWMRVLSRAAQGHVERSPFVKTGRAKKIVIEMDRKAPYELDGGARHPVKRLRVRVAARALTVCAPATAHRR